MQFFFCARSSHDNAALTHHTLSNVIALLENQLVKSHSQELNATVRVFLPLLFTISLQSPPATACPSHRTSGTARAAPTAASVLCLSLGNPTAMRRGASRSPAQRAAHATSAPRILRPLACSKRTLPFRAAATVAVRSCPCGACCPSWVACLVHVPRHPSCACSIVPRRGWGSNHRASAFSAPRRRPQVSCTCRYWSHHPLTQRSLEARESCSPQVCRELVLREMHPKAKKKAELPAGGLEAPAVATQEVEVQPEGTI